MINPGRHQEKIEKKLIQKGNHYVHLRGFITLAALALLCYFFYTHQYLLAGATFFGAAVVVSLQNFVSSFFAYIYITSTAQFEEGDIIRTGNPFMTAFGEVRRIGFFFTTIKEVDNEMLFTGNIVAFPNHLIFTGGIFNYTRNDLLFWHEFTTLLDLTGREPHKQFQHFRTIIMKEYYRSLEDNEYYEESAARDSNPKFDIKITERGMEIKTRLLIHFYKLLETNNNVMLMLLDEHKKGGLHLVKNKDYLWIE